MADALLGKLRALEAQMRDCSSWDRGTAQTDLAGLLPAIIAQIERLTAPADDDARLERTMDAIAQALGDAYDCTRAWSAWQVGTMSEDDFVPIVEQPDRLAEIAQAAINAVQPVQPSADPPEPYQAPDDNDWSPCEIYV